jgi:hypothetical protein
MTQIIQTIGRTTNGNYLQIADQWLNHACYFYQSTYFAESEGIYKHTNTKCYIKV